MYTVFSLLSPWCGWPPNFYRRIKVFQKKRLSSTYLGTSKCRDVEVCRNLIKRYQNCRILSLTPIWKTSSSFTTRVSTSDPLRTNKKMKFDFFYLKIISSCWNKFRFFVTCDGRRRWPYCEGLQWAANRSPKPLHIFFLLAVFCA